MRWIVIAGLLAVGATLAVAASAEAQPVAGGKYLGSYKGGTVKLEVSDDGKLLESFQVTNAQGQGCAGWLAQEQFGTRPILIENDQFSASPFPSLSIVGSFATPNTAQGTFDIGPSMGRGAAPPTCPRQLTSWTAVGDADPPALVLNAPGSQSRLKKTIRVEVSCPGEPCDVTVTGVVSLKARGSTRRYRLWSDPPENVRGTATVTLTVPLRAGKAIRALGPRGRLTAKIKAIAVDRFGHAASSKRTIRLVP